MAIVSGIVAINGRGEVSAQQASALKRGLSRHPSDQPHVIAGPGHAIGWVDCGVSALRFHVSHDAGVTAVIGSPLVVSLSPADAEGDDALVLHRALAGDAVAMTALLRGACGDFCAVHVDPSAKRLVLATDKLGLRPLYYATLDGCVYFSSVLRVMEQMLASRLTADIDGVTQLATLGCTFGARTPYAQIACIEPGHTVTFSSEGAIHTCYWNWDSVAEQPVDDDHAAGATLFAAMQRAVRRRLGGDKAAVAFLSGGLDSRCVVALLRAEGARVDSINFAPRGTADAVLGHRIAQALGTWHVEFPDGPPEFWERMCTAVTEWRNVAAAEALPPRPYALWCGEGGERIVAPVNIDAAMVRALRSVDVSNAVHAYLAREYALPPKRMFAASWGGRLRQRLHETLSAEFARRAGEDPVQRFRVMLLVNEARGQLARHYEDIDLRRFELVAPFLDAEVIQASLSISLERLARHRFYYAWLQRFLPVCWAAPWQAYPNSEPCPLPLPPGLRLQSDGWLNARQEAQLHAQTQRQVAQALSRADFPAWLLNRTVLRVASGLARFGVHRYMYMLGMASRYLRYVSARES